MQGALRIVTASQFIEHGTKKLFNFPGHQTRRHLERAAPGSRHLEFAGGIPLALLTRPVASLICGEMAIAYFMAHMPRDFFPANNSGDAAISFCFTFLYLVFAGPGALALDNRRSVEPPPAAPLPPHPL